MGHDGVSEATIVDGFNNAVRLTWKHDETTPNGSAVSTVTALPSREDITLPIQEQLIVELYSK